METGPYSYTGQQVQGQGGRWGGMQCKHVNVLTAGFRGPQGDSYWRVGFVRENQTSLTKSISVSMTFLLHFDQTVKFMAENGQKTVNLRKYFLLRAGLFAAKSEPPGGF